MDFFELLNYADLFTPYGSSPFDSLWISLTIAGALFVILYVLEAIALWTISGREGYKHRWMSFIPFFNTYYIGVVSDKNRFYNLPSKGVSLALAIIELLLVAGYILYYSIAGIVFAGGLYDVITQTSSITGQTIVIGYQSSGVISGTWIGWIFDYLDIYILQWFNLVYLLLNVLVVISFFQTYACRRYVLMSLGAVIFPIKGILMFAVRNNTGMNYRDYVRGEQRRRYEMYQQYSNQNGGNPYGGYNPYNGRPTAPPSDGKPYEGSSAPSGSDEDPFGGFGASDGGKSSAAQPDDPFDEFKN